jgi:hypothetical protein
VTAIVRKPGRPGSFRLPQGDSARLCLPNQIGHLHFRKGICLLKGA